MKLYMVEDNEGWRYSFVDRTLRNAKERIKEFVKDPVFKGTTYYIHRIDTKNDEITYNVKVIKKDEVI